MTASSVRPLRLVACLLAFSLAAIGAAWSNGGFEIPSRVLPAGETAPAQNSDSEFSFVVYGDIQGNYHQGHNRLVSRILQEDAGFVFNTGDISEDNGQNYDEAFFPVIEPLLATKQYLPSPGNHDVLFNSPNSRSSYRMFFGEVLKKLSFLPDNSHLLQPDGQQLWYALARGPALFVVLDSNWFIDEGRYSKTSSIPTYARYPEAQLRWLSALLEKQSALPYKFIFFHHSPIISREEGSFAGVGGHPGHARMLVDLKTPDGGYLLDLFRRHRVTAVFTGHEHYYERWREEILDASGRPVHRLNWVVNGLGGVKPRGRPEYDPSEIRKVLAQEYLKNYLGRIGTSEAGLKSQLVHSYPTSGEEAISFPNYALVRITRDGATFAIKDCDGRVRDSDTLCLPASAAVPAGN